MKGKNEYHNSSSGSINGGSVNLQLMTELKKANLLYMFIIQYAFQAFKNGNNNDVAPFSHHPISDTA